MPVRHFRSYKEVPPSPSLRCWLVGEALSKMATHHRNRGLPKTGQQFPPATNFGPFSVYQCDKMCNSMYSRPATKHRPRRGLPLVCAPLQPSFYHETTLATYGSGQQTSPHLRFWGVISRTSLRAPAASPERCLSYS